jgi:hypothetical protein
LIGDSFPPLSNAAGTGPFREGDPFRNLGVVRFYWSSTSDPVDGPWDSLIWEPDNGRINGLHKTNTTLMWPVRSR